MRRFYKTLFVTSAVVAAGLSGRTALAQSDINPPIPNVMLLLDTSGSMENMANDLAPEDAANNTPNAATDAACKPGVATKPNKWATLVQVLTGDIDNFSCEPIDRTTADFKKEYSLPPNGGATAPYDADYFLPHHRLLSNGCGPAPGDMPANWYDWPANAIKYHAIGPTKTACNNWSQQQNGVIDTFKDQIRFGLGTFDTLPDAGTGAAGAAVVPGTGVAGNWSYFLNWNNGGSPAQGNPPNCKLANFEVGFRNPAAPPWEGRLLGFGDPDAAVQDVMAQNNRVEQELVALRPYGATPLIGMLSDAKDFLYSDTMVDPSTSKQFGPGGANGDPYWQAGCRKTFIILLSDGAPNLDLLPVCNGLGSNGGANGVCPYGQKKYAWDYAYDIAHPGQAAQAVKIFTVAFGLTAAKDNANKAVDCKALKPGDFNAGGTCDAPKDLVLQGCCNMLRIAMQGHPAAMLPACTDATSCGAYFADDGANLKAALAAVLAQIASSATSRTMPVNVAAGGVAMSGAVGASNAAAVSYQFLAGFTPAVGAALWQGTLVRKRWVCDANLVASVEDVDPGKGDDFAANLDSIKGTRSMFTVVGTTDASGLVRSDRSIRPVFTSKGLDDGLGLYGGTPKGPSDPDTFAADLSGNPAALNVAANNAACSSLFGSPVAAACVKKVVSWEVGANVDSGPATRLKANCPAGKTCSLMGAIYHSTPALSGPPREYLRDESYATFATTYKTPQQNGHAQMVATRPLSLYTATTDGQLHGFVVGINELNYVPNAGPGGPIKNEIFSFVPPAVLPSLLSSYNSQSVLLDGAPVIKDVVFARSKKMAIAPGDGTAWNTVLVAGSGASASGGFYYAVDITDPKVPLFLWQLSTDSAGVKLFGDSVPQPAIATITLKDGADFQEVAVAILPGGSAASANGACPRDVGDSAKNLSLANIGTPPRAAVHCWGKPNTVNPARSVTIVRLDTGEVLVSMRGKTLIGGVPTDDGPTFAAAVTHKKYVGFDSPMVGTPVPFPAGTGQVANRVYVGDADGTLWRIDLSSTDTTAWSAAIAWDGHVLASDTATTGQPIATPPILSVDSVGNTVILFSTGDQQLFTSKTNVQTRVWSILEKPMGTKFVTAENWHVDLADGALMGGPGARAVGPMSLFNSTVYFSVFTPNPVGSPVCDAATGDGTGYVWAVDYLIDDSPTGKTSKKPLQRWDLNAATKPWWTSADMKGATPFGVAITQTPSCLSTQTTNDEYAGSHTAVSGASGVSYSLVIQTGAKGGAKQNNAPLNTVTKNLPAPKRMTRMDSWASVIE